MGKDAKVGELFTVEKFENDGLLFLRIIPKVECEGYPPLILPIVAEQWDTIRFHFMQQQAMGHPEKLVRVAYVY